MVLGYVISGAHYGWRRRYRSRSTDLSNRGFLCLLGKYRSSGGICWSVPVTDPFSIAFLRSLNTIAS